MGYASVRRNEILSEGGEKERADQIYVSIEANNASITPRKRKKLEQVLEMGVNYISSVLLRCKPNLEYSTYLFVYLSFTEFSKMYMIIN